MTRESQNVARLRCSDRGGTWWLRPRPTGMQVEYSGVDCSSPVQRSTPDVQQFVGLDVELVLSRINPCRRAALFAAEYTRFVDICIRQRVPALQSCRCHVYWVRREDAGPY